MVPPENVVNNRKKSHFEHFTAVYLYTILLVSEKKTESKITADKIIDPPTALRRELESEREGSNLDSGERSRPASPSLSPDLHSDCTIYFTTTISRRAKFVREMKYARAEVRFDGRLLEVNRRCVQRDREAGDIPTIALRTKIIALQRSILV